MLADLLRTLSKSQKRNIFNGLRGTIEADVLTTVRLEASGGWAVVEGAGDFDRIRRLPRGGHPSRERQ